MNTLNAVNNLSSLSSEYFQCLSNNSRETVKQSMKLCCREWITRKLQNCVSKSPKWKYFTLCLKISYFWMYEMYSRLIPLTFILIFSFIHQHHSSHFVFFLLHPYSHSSLRIIEIHYENIIFMLAYSHY